MRSIRTTQTLDIIADAEREAARHRETDRAEYEAILIASTTGTKLPKDTSQYLAELMGRLRISNEQGQADLQFVRDVLSAIDSYPGWQKLIQQIRVLRSRGYTILRRLPDLLEKRQRGPLAKKFLSEAQDVTASMDSKRAAQDLLERELRNDTPFFRRILDAAKPTFQFEQVADGPIPDRQAAEVELAAANQALADLVEAQTAQRDALDIALADAMNRHEVAARQLNRAKATT